MKNSSDNKIHFLPWGSCVLKTKLSPEVISRCLQYETSNSYFEAVNNRTYFFGNVDDEKFRIKYTGVKKDSDFYMRNSFYPVFVGDMYTEEGETVIEIKWHLPVAVIIFMCLWFLGVGFALYITLTVKAGAVTLIPVIMLIAAAAFMIFGVNSGLKATKAILKKVL